MTQRLATPISGGSIASRIWSSVKVIRRAMPRAYDGTLQNRPAPRRASARTPDRLGAMDEEMLEAHIAFEVAAWTESLTETLTAQTNVIFEWLDGVTLGSVFSEADLDALIDAIVIPDLSASVMAVRWWALNDQTPSTNS